MAVAGSSHLLVAGGLPESEIERWHVAAPDLPAPPRVAPDRLPADARAATHYFQLGDQLLHRLPPKPNRGDRERGAAEAIAEALRDVRVRFLRAYRDHIYAELTDDYRTFVRVDELVYAAAERYPGLVPSRSVVAAERELQQADKEGAEIEQGIFLGQVFSSPRAGAHLVQAMLRPLPESLERLDDFRRTGVADLGPAYVRREGKAGILELRNTRFLNAEDDSTLVPNEVAVDLLLLDPAIEVAVIRGGLIDHPKYRGRRVFSAGINLTHLYHGKISFLFYATRDLGFVNKMYRGLAGPEFWPDEAETTIEKPWIAAVEAFAIGGGCQLLLVMDHILAEADSFFNLPARKEGIIPGCANLRLPRFVGDRLTRQGILFDRQFPADSPEGRLLCDRLLPAGGMDAAIAEAVDGLTGSGVVSAAGNRKAIRVAQEPLDVFRAYMATYLDQQAFCHFSPSLIRNLEKHWNARERRA